MLTQTVTITQNSNPNIIIGRRSTYETQQVIFDVSWLIQTYGEGTAELLIKRPKDASAYPVVATLDGNTLTWTVSETDTQDKGHGECEIYWYVNGGLAKSCICGITILRDIGDTTETAPDPYETWVDELARLGAETLANAQAAEQSANNAAQSASEADNSAAAALESEENALNSENAAKASEQAAAASAQGAEQSASAAESSEANAQESADNSSASADRAEQAAASIEGDTERAEAAAREAQGAASYASVFADTASAKATEAAGSAATAEQAARTATQESADASAAATAAVDSASSASASATAADNAQTAAETAQGKAEDAQEAAETAAQSIEDSAAQITQNAEDIVDLKSILDTKAGIIRDTASGSIASFVPDSTVPNLLGLSVALEPIQDLHGYDNPWPAGGNVNLLPYNATVGTQTINGVTWNLHEDGSISISGTATEASTFRYFFNPTEFDPYFSGNYIFYAFPGGIPTGDFQGGVKIGARWYSVYAYGNTNISDADGQLAEVWFQVRAGRTLNTTIYPMIYPADAQTPTSWTPYSNICPISGRESVEVEAAGKNLFDADTLSQFSGVVVNDDGSIFANNNNALYNKVIWKNPGYSGQLSLTFRYKYANTGAIGLYLKAVYTDGTAASFSVQNSQDFVTATFTTASNKIVDYITTTYSTGGNSTTFYLQVELGSTATAYEPYSGTTYTIQLGDTVYGGTLDVVNGTLTVDMAMVDMGTLNWVYITNDGDPYFRALLTGKRPGLNMICSSYGTSQTTGTGSLADKKIGAAANDTRVYVRDSAYTDLNTFISAMSGVMLCYELATPITINLDPVQIATIANQINNVWADAGDVAVEYAADLKHYIDTKIAAAVAAMS